MNLIQTLLRLDWFLIAVVDSDLELWYGGGRRGDAGVLQIYIPGNAIVIITLAANNEPFPNFTSSGLVLELSGGSSRS